MMTPYKIALGSVGLFTLLVVFSITRIPTPEPSKAKGTWKLLPQGEYGAREWEFVDRSIPTVTLAQMSFETPSWIPDEDTKKRALLRAYHLNGDKMVGGMIDVSNDPVVTGVTPAEQFNEMDKAAPFNERVLVPPPMVKEEDKPKLKKSFDPR